MEKELSHYLQYFAIQNHLSKRCASYPTLPFLPTYSRAAPRRDDWGGGERGPFKVDSFQATPIGIMLNAEKIAGDRSPPPGAAAHAIAGTLSASTERGPEPQSHLAVRRRHCSAAGGRWRCGRTVKGKGAWRRQPPLATPQWRRLVAVLRLPMAGEVAKVVTPSG